MSVTARGVRILLPLLLLALVPLLLFSPRAPQAAAAGSLPATVVYPPYYGYGLTCTGGPDSIRFYAEEGDIVSIIPFISGVRKMQLVLYGPSGFLVQATTMTYLPLIVQQVSSTGEYRLTLSGGSIFDPLTYDLKITTSSTTTSTWFPPTTTTTTLPTTTVTLPPVTTTTTTSTTVPGPPAFTDIPVGSSRYNAIQTLAGRSIVNGFKDGTFRAWDTVKRQQFAKMVVLTFGLQVYETDKSPFTDLGPDDPSTLYPHQFVAVAWKNGITKGSTPTAYKPFDNIWRWQVITMVVRAVDNLRPGLLESPPSDWWVSWGWYLGLNGTPYLDDARKADYNGLMAGLDIWKTDPDLGYSRNPYGSMERGEIAQVLYNTLLLLDE